MSASAVPILIFDGDCGFCTSAANFVVRRSSTVIKAIPWQRTNLADFGLTVEQASSKVYLITKDGQAFGGHEAFAGLLRLERNGLLRILGSLLTLPPISWFAAGGYRLVAKYRHKLSGGTPACKLP